MADCSTKLTSHCLHANKQILKMSTLQLDFKTVAQGTPFLKIQWKIHFFYLLNTDRSATTIFFRIVIIQHFMIKLLSQLILDHGKCPNQKTCAFTFMRFLVGALSEVQNCFRKQFLHKVLYNNYSKKIWSDSSKKMALKKQIFHCIFKM